MFDADKLTTVDWLNARGWITADSGDGTKTDMGCAMPVHNVVITGWHRHGVVDLDPVVVNGVGYTPATNLRLRDADRLLEQLNDDPCMPGDVPPGHISLSYDPVDEIVVIVILGIYLDGEQWKFEPPSPPFNTPVNERPRMTRWF